MSEQTQTQEKHQLQDSWTIWFHKMYDNNWGIDSYKNIYTFSTIEDFWSVYNSIIPHMRHGILFIMKEGIQPIWEDEQNLSGCSVSYIADDYENQWRELCIGLISNNLITSDNELNGISCCPKKQNFLLKLWMKNCNDPKTNKEFNIDLTKTQKKVHKDNIH